MNILEKIANKQLSPRKAYRQMYRKKTSKERKLRKAHFIKLRMKFKDEKGLNTLCKVLFALPVPAIFVKKQLSKGDKSDYLAFLLYKGVKITIISDDAEINIKTI